MGVVELVTTAVTRWPEVSPPLVSRRHWASGHFWVDCTRHSATPTTTLIFHGSFTLHWHFSQISNIKNPHFPTEFRYEGLNEATSRSPAIPCHCVMSDSRVSGQVATVSVKSLQSVGCCQGPGRGWAGLHSGLSSDQLGLWTSASVGQFWHRWKCWVTNDDSYTLLWDWRQQKWHSTLMCVPYINYSIFYTSVVTFFI